MICTQCGREVNYYLMCDKDSPEVNLCGECYDKSPCATEHEEDCGTLVIEGK